MLTPASDPGNVSSWYVTEVDDDTFDIAVDTAPTSQIEFGWQGSL